MSCACGKGAGSGCVCDGFTSALEVDFCESLVGSLTCTVDAARDLFTQFGARPYAVFLVWTRWSGGVRGQGTEFVVCTREILPTPNVVNINSLYTVVEEIGALEDGGIKINEISLRYTEDDLAGLTGGPPSENGKLPRDVNFYWEIQLKDADGCLIRRRLTQKSAPNRNALKFEWSVQLIRQSEDRTRKGSPA